MTTDFRETTLEKLAEPPTRDEPDWLAERRDRARRLFRESGFPTTKDEQWRFTSVRPIARVPFVDAPASTVHLEGDAPEGVTVRSLKALLREAPAEVEPYLGKLAEPEFFAALNAALFDDGLVVTIAKGTRVDRPIELIAHLDVDTPTVTYPRILVLAGEGSEATLVERIAGEKRTPTLTNGVTEIVLAPNASLEHVRVLEGTPSSHTVATLAVRQERDSRFASRVFTFGGALDRLDVHVTLDGEGADCRLDGLYIADDDAHVDHQTRVEHRSPHASSGQTYKGILAGRGHAVFDGTIVVHRDAQRSDAHQENRNLLLSDDATIHTKPHLRIDADDVSCSHGATVGRLDGDQLFYLRARGIGEGEAHALLTYAFARQLVDRIGTPKVAKELAAKVVDHLPRGNLVAAALEEDPS